MMTFKPTQLPRAIWNRHFIKMSCWHGSSFAQWINPKPATSNNSKERNARKKNQAQPKYRAAKWNIACAQRRIMQPSLFVLSPLAAFWGRKQYRRRIMCVTSHAHTANIMLNTAYRRDRSTWRTVEQTRPRWCSFLPIPAPFQPIWTL